MGKLGVEFKQFVKIFKLKNYRYIRSTHSTNCLLKELLKSEALPEFFSVRTAFQTAGKGQMGNSWESERGKNLLFSMHIKPHSIPIDEQFIVSQLVSVSLVQVLKNYHVDCSIKWPNDLYVGNKKIGGMLIENNVRGSRIEHSMVGIGLNVNQTVFKSNAPNPTSLKNILSVKISVKMLFAEISKQLTRNFQELNPESIRSAYHAHLYRKKGSHTFQYLNGNCFDAEIMHVEKDGKLHLKKSDGSMEGFYFKEVRFVL